MTREIVIDLFAGGGGASVGIHAALGRGPDIAINHDPIALAVHKANHPATRHAEADIWEVRPRDAVGGRPVGLLWASPDCTDFSAAKGGKPRRQPCEPDDAGMDVALECTELLEAWPDALEPLPICLKLSRVCSFRCGQSDALASLCRAYGGDCTGTNGDGHCDPSPE